MAIKKIASLLAITLLIAGSAFAQPVTVQKSEVKTTEAGTTFYIHTVEQGQTLFSIARAYEIDQSEIIKHNPSAAAGLLANQELKIPDKDAAVAAEHLLHTVAAGETLFGIARKYGVTVQQVSAANPDINNFENLSIGQQIKIPVTMMLGEAVMLTEKEGDSLIIHNVQRGESLFGIARQYNVHSDSIVAWNPELIESTLRRGQDIRIKVKVKRSVPVTKATIDIPVYDTLLHQIKEKETIWGLARRYNTTVEHILQLNPELSESLKAGYYIYIPVPKDRSAIRPATVATTTVTTAKGCENSRFRSKYKVALLIPLYLDDIDRIHITPSSDEQLRKPFFTPFRFIEFYEGLIIAVDSMQKAGLSIDLHVYDTGNDSIQVKRILAKPEMPHMDLIIGPFFAQNYNITAKFAAQHNIKIVSPFVRSPELISQHSNLFHLNASPETKMHELAAHIALSYQDFNLIMVISGSKDDKSLSNEFKKSLEANTASFARKPQYNEVIYTERGLAGVSTRLDVNKPNIVVNLITGETMISNYISNMAKLTRNFNITMYGLPEWQGYRTFNLNDLMSVNLHLFDNTFVDYSNPNTIAFLKEFRSRYKGEPEENNYGYLGYDVGLYFLKALFDYGLDFENCLDQMKYNHISTGFRWKQVNGKGYENTFLNLYRFDDFKMEVVRQAK